MANTVIALKKSATPDAVPINLANGELALNYADGKLYFKRANGQIGFISPPAQSDSFGTVNANGTLIVSDTAGDILTLIAGSNIQIVGDAINDTVTISASVTGGGGTITVGNTLSGTYTSRSTQNTINFIPGDNVYINVDNDATNGRANVTITANAPGGWWAPTTSIVTGNSVSAAKDTRYFLTNNSSTIVTLPATPTQGDTIYVVVTNQLANNVIARNGNKIMSLSEDLTLDITYYSIGFTYIDANLGWVII